jgi:phage terminase large subunit-like protein
VIELYESVAQPLDPWQKFLLLQGFQENTEGNWLCFECAELLSRQNGKGGVLEAVALAGLFLLGDRLTGWSAHEFKTCREGFLRVRGWIDGSDDLRSQVKAIRTSHGEEGIELLDGRRLLFMARSTGSGRGFTGDRLILDEAQHLGFKALGAILPTMSARPNPQVWYAATAPDHTVAPCEVLARIRKRALRKNDASLMYAEWSIDPHSERCARTCTHHDEPGDEASWAKANPAMGIRVRVEHIRKEYAAMDAATFAQERLGVGNWPPDEEEWEVISQEDWAAAADPDSEMQDPVCFAVDVSPASSWGSIAAAGTRADTLTSVEVIDHRRTVAWMVPRIVELQERWKPLGWVIDKVGPSGSLIPELEAQGFLVVPFGTEVPPHHHGGVILVPGAREVAAGCVMVYRGITDAKSLRHRNQPELAAALAAATTRNLGDSWAWDRKGSGPDITPLMAATLACWGLAVRGHLRRSRPAPFAIRGR